MKRWTTIQTAATALVIIATAATSVACGASGSSSASGDSAHPGVALILKTLTNPYFVAMEQQAKAEAKKAGVTLTVAAGTANGDTQSQISAIDNAISRGDKGILITINGDAVNTALRQAKKAGLFVIALDTAPNPASVADITYATDNEQAAKLDGQYAAARLDGKKAVIAMLDDFNDQVISIDVQRDHGFLEGMGIDPGSSTLNGKEAKSGSYSKGQYQLACQQPTQGAEDGGRTAMETCLSANSNINVVYAFDEPAAVGANAALKAAGRADIPVYAIDGSCQGVGYVRSGVFAADAAQYPGKMASLGVDAIAKLVRDDTKPQTTSGKDFFDTGTALVAHTPVPGITSQTPAQAGNACWGSPN